MAEDALEFLASSVRPGAVTLETGCGASTAVLAWRGAAHTALFLGDDEGEALRDWLRRAGVRTDGLTLVAGSSTVSLPRLVASEQGPRVDLLIIDGCHAFPFPMVDWYFGAKLLKKGGMALVDDVQLPAPRQLVDFLAADPRWTQLVRTPRWAAYRKEEDWSHDEEWTSQPFYRPHGQRRVELQLQVAPWRVRAGHLVARCLRVARRLLAPR